MAIPKNQDEFIEELLNPIDDIMSEVDTKVLTIITERIRNIGKMSASDAQRLSIIARNKDLAEIEKIISDATDLSIKQVNSIVEESARNNDDLAVSLYKARNLPPSNYLSDLSLLNAVQTAQKSIVDDIVKLSGTTVMKMNGKDISIEKAYNYAVNRAAFEVQQGVFDFNTAIRSTIKQLADSGVRTVDYASGYSRNLYSAVRMNVSDSVRNMNANYREIQGEQVGADGVEISAHALCSRDHVGVQGRQYSKAEYERLQSTLIRPISTLNCKHFAMPIILGISKPAYSDNQLQEMEDNSNKKVEYSTLQKDKDGNFIKKSVSKYDFSQVQRQVENDIRKLKVYQNQLDVLGDKTGSALVQKKISDKTRYYKSISKQGGLSPKMEKIRIVK